MEKDIDKTYFQWYHGRFQTLYLYSILFILLLRFCMFWPHDCKIVVVPSSIIYASHLILSNTRTTLSKQQNSSRSHWCLFFSHWPEHMTFSTGEKLGNRRLDFPEEGMHWLHELNLRGPARRGIVVPISSDKAAQETKWNTAKHQRQIPVDLLWPQSQHRCHYLKLSPSQILKVQFSSTSVQQSSAMIKAPYQGHKLICRWTKHHSCFRTMNHPGGDSHAQRSLMWGKQMGIIPAETRSRDRLSGMGWSR